MSFTDSVVAWYLNLCDLAIMALMPMFGLGCLLAWIAILLSPMLAAIYVLYQIVLLVVG